MTAHGLHHYSFQFLLFELAQCVTLRLKRLDESVAVAAKGFSDDLMHPLVDNVIRDLVAFLFERLDHKASVNQIF